VYSLAWSQQIDAPAFTDALQTFFKDVAPDADAEAIQRMRQTLEHLTIETTGVYRYDAVRGLITHATLSRQSSIEGRGRIDTWEWRGEPKRGEPGRRIRPSGPTRRGGCTPRRCPAPTGVCAGSTTTFCRRGWSCRGTTASPCPAGRRAWRVMRRRGWRRR